MLAGTGAIAAALTATLPAKPPHPASATTRSPTATPSTPSPRAATTPATSLPGEKGRGGLNWDLSSVVRKSGEVAPHGGATDPHSAPPRPRAAGAPARSPLAGPD